MASNASEPLIGLTTYLEPVRFGLWDTRGAVLHQAYVDCVRAAGGNPVLLPPGGDWRPETVGWLDGLVITGGADVNPAAYGQEPGPLTDAPRQSRDDSEFSLARAALSSGLPLLGVCRGMQVLNVVLGGTLHQHVEGHVKSPGVFAETEVDVVRGSALEAVVGSRTTVQCHHHQALDVLGEGLRAVATAPDGIVEGVELEGSGFALGVQSHPEQDIEDVRLFAALVQAAKERARR
ncbi:gamma-glutamyl-gamma-aminobutyrate hydrolase family protein [Umezawaea endophytica]|uniref:Gamma-glutamyl-gamma-aminobutyrate hydrolase family protein n=1 Tax=Umezawaea endophytica TaxID=1654476 RepID=A0A9X3A6C9_9PSEU|nr:gamma-glutamyl-gamma-aminobutyrate hydrolase family protein [Umezawaea endophytica]MCS7483238.1 gamma-glutamyl-gamma-aminobutyrate hydrolase family protein [Umezawaea endophytica]